MFGALIIQSSPADQGGPQAYGKEMLLNQNVELLESLTAVNKGDACYIQIFNTPRRLAVAITDTDMTTGVITAAGHGYVTGDKVTLSGIATLTTGYLRREDADTFTLHSTRALALGDDDPDLLPDADNDTGTFSLASDAASAPIAEEYPLAAAASAPSNVLSYTSARFTRGCYARAVTTQNGSTLISGDDVKFTPRYRIGPIAGPVSYED